MSLKRNNEKCPQREEEALFEVIGDYGPWQRDIFIIFFFINIIGVWQNMAITFLAPNPDYRCTSVDYSNPNTSNFLSFINLPSNGSSILDETTNQCEFIINPELHLNGSYSEKKYVPCNQWEFNSSMTPQSIVSEWNLVCEREWLVSLAKSIYMVGFMASVLVFGQVSDSFGRFPTIMICWVITCISGVLSAFSTSYTMFIILRFLMAFGRTGLTTTGYVIIMEIIGPKWRTEFGIAIQVGWSVGFVSLPAVAWFLRHWVHLQLALSVPTLGFAVMYWIVPESPRWLMTQRKRKEFEAVITKAVKKNGLNLKDDIANILPFPSPKAGDEAMKKMTFIDLVRTPQMRKRTINVAILWAVNAFVYYSLSYNTNDLGGDPYLNFFLSGVMEFPSYILVFITVRKWGRKMPTLIGMLIGGAACAAIIPLPLDMHWLSITFAMIGKLCITGTFGILYLYTSEMFPTVVRNLAIGASSTCGRVGSIVAPFVRELGKATNSWAPNAVNAGLSISAGLLVLLLPETKDKRIPDTLEEGEKFGQKLPTETYHNGQATNDHEMENKTDISKV